MYRLAKLRRFERELADAVRGGPVGYCRHSAVIDNVPLSRTKADKVAFWFRDGLSTNDPKRTSLAALCAQLSPIGTPDIRTLGSPPR